MRWLRSILRISSKSAKPNQRNNSDGSFFAVSVYSDQLICTWKIRDESKAMIQRDFDSALFIRIKDISGDQSISSKVIQVSLNQDTTNINLPSRSGKFLIENLFNRLYRLPDHFFLDLGRSGEAFEAVLEALGALLEALGTSKGQGQSTGQGLWAG